MNAPVATERKSFLPLRLRATTLGSNAIPVVARPTALSPASTARTSPVMIPNAPFNTNKSTLIVGTRVLVNGLKSGVLRYVGTVKFAEGQFCGVELDDPDGKHDGQVNNIRYFQCEPNRGIFVPRDKVVAVQHERASRPVSRLKAPTMTRSVTLSSSINTAEHTAITPTQVQLPDIVPSRTPQFPSTPKSSSTPQSPSTPPPSSIPQPMVVSTAVPEVKLTERTVETTIEIVDTPFEPQPLTIDESPEPIEADFTDSVSLILHQLQQENRPLLPQPRASITISEEGTVDDDEVDEFDDESVIEPAIEEQSVPRPSSLSSSVFTPLVDTSKIVQTDFSFDVHDIITFHKETAVLVEKKSHLNPPSKLNKSLSTSSSSINKRKEIIPVIEPKTINKKKPPVPSSIPAMKKDVERRPIPLQNTAPRVGTSITVRKSSLVPPKKGPPVLHSAQSVTSLASPSKPDMSRSSSNSVNSSMSDLTSASGLLQRQISSSSQVDSRPTSGTARSTSHSIDLISTAGPTKRLSVTRRSVDVLDNQLAFQRLINQSLETSNERLKQRYGQLLNRFDVMTMLSQHLTLENEQLKNQYEFRLVQERTKKKQLRNIIEQERSSHNEEIATLHERYRLETHALKESHEKQLADIRAQSESILHEKSELECRCASLQERIDMHMAEMANSEHADALLCHVETLEKDRTSLQTVLEMKNRELTQLRTKLNEQVFQLEDKLALQKRIDMAENRNEDLVCLLRQRQLSEKATVVERDQLKELVAQLEHDNQYLTFENETLLYRLRERSFSVSMAPDPATFLPRISLAHRPRSRHRTCSCPTITVAVTSENDCMTRSLPPNFMINDR